jgi:hypothetical protein
MAKTFFSEGVAQLSTRVARQLRGSKRAEGPGTVSCLNFAIPK